MERKACQTENDNLAVNYQGECGKKSEGMFNTNIRRIILFVSLEFFYVRKQSDFINNLQRLYFCFVGSGNREDESDVKPRQNGQQNCCCMHVSSSCPNPFSPKPNNGNGGSNAFLSAASPRFGPEEEEEEEVEDNIFIGSRIVNKLLTVNTFMENYDKYIRTFIFGNCCHWTGQTYIRSTIT